MTEQNEPRQEGRPKILVVDDTFAARRMIAKKLRSAGYEVVDPREMLEVVAMALGISFLAPVLPAWLAARLDPVEALRYE